MMLANNPGVVDLPLEAMFLVPFFRNMLLVAIFLLLGGILA